MKARCRLGRHRSTIHHLCLSLSRNVSTALGTPIRGHCVEVIYRPGILYLLSTRRQTRRFVCVMLDSKKAITHHLQRLFTHCRERITATLMTYFTIFIRQSSMHEGYYDARVKDIGAALTVTFYFTWSLLAFSSFTLLPRCLPSFLYTYFIQISFHIALLYNSVAALSALLSVFF